MDIWVGLSFSPMLSPLQLDWRGLRTRRGWPCTTQLLSTTRRMFLSKVAGLSTWRTCTLRPRRDSRYNSKKVRHRTTEDSVIDELYLTCDVFFVVDRKQEWTEFPWWWKCCCKLYGNDLSFFIIAFLRSHVFYGIKTSCACLYVCAALPYSLEILYVQSKISTQRMEFVLWSQGPSLGILIPQQAPPGLCSPAKVNEWTGGKTWKGSIRISSS